MDDRKIPEPTYHRDKDRLIKDIDAAYTAMYDYLVSELSFNPAQPKIIRELQILKQMDVWLADMDAQVREGVEALITKTFTQGQAYHLLSISQVSNWNEALAAASFNVLQKSKIEALYADTYQDILLATNNTKQSVKKVVRDTVRKVAQYNSLKNTNYTEQAEQLAKELSKKGLSESVKKEGFVGIVDKKGRKWDLRTYSNMVIKTKVNQAHIEGIRHEATETGCDLAIISSHGAEDACSKWEGVIISLTGANEGFPTYEDGRKTQEIWHPNCEHTLHPVRSLDLLPPDEVALARKKAKELGYSIPENVKISPPNTEAASEMPDNVQNYEIELNKNTQIYSKLGEEHSVNMHNMLTKAPVTYQRLWESYESAMKVYSTTHTGGAYYDREVKGVFMDMAEISQGNHYATPYQTAFHELAHNMDFEAATRSGDTSGLPYSYIYKDNKLGKTLQSEWDSRVKALDSRLKKEFKENANNVAYFYDRGMMTLRTKDYYEAMPNEWVPPKYKKAYAYEQLQKELREIPLIERGNLSDIIEAQSNAKVIGGIGHGKKYWQYKPRLSSEPFAEMFDALIANPEALSHIQRYFPESFDVFNEMIIEMSKL